MCSRVDPENDDDLLVKNVISQNEGAKSQNEGVTSQNVINPPVIKRGSNKKRK